MESSDSFHQSDDQTEVQPLQPIEGIVWTHTRPVTKGTPALMAQLERDLDKELDRLYSVRAQSNVAPDVFFG